MDGWNQFTGPTLLNYSDPNFAKVVAAKKALQIKVEADANSESDNLIIEMYLAAGDGDLVTLENMLRQNPEYVNQAYPQDHGVTLLVYAICFDQAHIVDSLLLHHNADPDMADGVVGYTPLMWAVYFNQLDIVKSLLNQQADPYLSPKDDGKNAVSLLNPENMEMSEYFRSHNLLNKLSDTQDDLFFQSNDFQPHDEIDNLSNQIKLQTISADTTLLTQEEEERDYNEENELARDHVLVQLKEFEYDKVLPDEYIKYTDSDIPLLLDFIFNLRINKVAYQHDTKIPAAIVFQLIRYAHLKVESKELTEFTFDCFIARLRSVTNTKSGVFNMIIHDDPNSVGGAGDIVLLSYWLSVIQFLHFYFSKSEIYKSHPVFLQELINIIQSLVSTLSFSINSRLNLLVDDCLLNFTNLVDVSNVLYAKDWNLFKSKKTHSNSFDDIYNMLYPPSQIELMKPSPLKYIQTLGALDYVLNLHQVDNLIRFQCFSQVFYYINAMIFNKIISQSKYCSRAKAIQIRLNISAIEDWLRSHNYKIYKPDTLGGLDQIVRSNFQLNNLLNDDPKTNKRNPQNLVFLYNSIYYIGKTQLQPTIELLQFLQCMSLLTDEESLINTINQFDYLNYFQLVKVIKNYKYEVEEPKLSKPLVNVIKRLMNEQGDNQIKFINLNYMIQNKLLLKEYNIYINPNHVYPAALPNLAELITNYGSGLGGVRTLRAKKFQPSLPIEVLDDVDELLSLNKNDLNDTYDYENDQESGDHDQLDEEDKPEEKEDVKSKEGNKGDELFRQVQMPLSLVHKNWGDDDIETNPW